MQSSRASGRGGQCSWRRWIRGVPWEELLAVIAPHYPRMGHRGRQPCPLETMLRIHLLQQGYALSDPAMEEALYEIAPLRQFARLSLLTDISDETTRLDFRHLLERNPLAEKRFSSVNTHLARYGKGVRSVPIVDLQRSKPTTRTPWLQQ